MPPVDPPLTSAGVKSGLTQHRIGKISHLLDRLDATTKGLMIAGISIPKYSAVIRRLSHILLSLRVRRQ